MEDATQRRRDITNESKHLKKLGFNAKGSKSYCNHRSSEILYYWWVYVLYIRVCAIQHFNSKPKLEKLAKFATICKISFNSFNSFAQNCIHQQKKELNDDDLKAIKKLALTSFTSVSCSSFMLTPIQYNGEKRVQRFWLHYGISKWNPIFTITKQWTRASQWLKTSLRLSFLHLSFILSKCKYFTPTQMGKNVLIFFVKSVESKTKTIT